MWHIRREVDKTGPDGLRDFPRHLDQGQFAHLETVTNFAYRTIRTGDNLDILRGLNSASVDLIYLDPPFSSNRNYAAPVGSAAAGAAFKDTSRLSNRKPME